MLSYADFHSYFRRLHAAYSALTVWRMPYVRMPVIRWKGYVHFGSLGKEPPKETEHVLRWMIRKGPEVDLVFGRDLIAGT